MSDAVTEAVSPMKATRNAGNDNAKLTGRQAALLRAIGGGVRVFFHPYMGRFNPSDYYSAIEIGRCTAQAKALLERGLVSKANLKPISREHQLEITDAGRAWIAANP